MMATKASTWIAFGAVAKRGITTAAPARVSSTHPLFARPPQHTHSLASKAAKSRKLPKNHFTSSVPRQEGEEGKSGKDERHQQSENKKKGPKRKAGLRQNESTSLRRVAVEAQRSRRSLIKGKGKMRHVDPEAETKDITAYCAAETYNIHVARDLMRREGYGLDPFNTAMFPQVLHVQTPNFIIKDEATGENREQGVGDVFVFPSGCVVTWNVSEKLAQSLVERVLIPAAENPTTPEAEDFEYLEDHTREDSQLIGDVILLGTKTTHTALAEAGERPDEPRTETDTALAQIAFSSALARSTKLAVLETTLNHYFSTTRSIPNTLSRGINPRFGRDFILRKTGELLHIRAQLNLYSELTDSLPDIFWDSPHELGLDNYYEGLSREMDVGARIKALNEKMDYASEIAAVLRERLSERHSHLLEWIIIWLIVIEVGYGSLHLWREWEEGRDEESVRNLAREWLAREMAKEDGKVQGKGRKVE